MAIPGKVRLNRYIASAGVTSRRKADQLIRAGAVRVNGKVIDEPGTQIDPKSEVFVRNKKIRAETESVCVMFNKPPNVVTTLNDPEGRPSVGDYFAAAKIRLFPIGRLDWASEGLLLLTNDGDFAQKVSHPTNRVTKTYLAKVNGQPTEEHLQKLVRGISIIGGKAKALSARRMESRGSAQYSWVQVIIDEGRNHQVRLMFQKIGFDVMKLQRIAIGSLKLSTLEKGKFRILEGDDREKIFMLPKEIRNERGEVITEDYKRKRPSRAGRSRKSSGYAEAARERRERKARVTPAR